METPSDRLRQARIKAGFRSATEAVERFGWTYQTYAAHENGNRAFHDDAETYARAFKVSLEWLLTGKGGTPSPERNALISDLQDLHPGEIEAIHQTVRAILAARGQGHEQSE